jgi:hypothetical protein
MLRENALIGDNAALKALSASCAKIVSLNETVAIVFC